MEELLPSEMDEILCGCRKSILACATPRASASPSPRIDKSAAKAERYYSRDG